MKIREKLKWKLTLIYSSVVFVVVLFFIMVFIFGVRHYYYGNIEEVLKHGVVATVDLYDLRLGDKPLADKAKLLLESGIIPDFVEAQVVDQYGKILDSTSRFIDDELIDSPDYISALEGRVSAWRGESEVNGEKIMAVSAPLTKKVQVVGAIRYITSLELIEETLFSYYLWAITLGVSIIAFTFIISYVLAKKIVEPVINLKNIADHYAVGQFDKKAKRYADDELGELADAFNYMSDEIVRSKRIKNEFISSISHEIRTPLTSIMAWSETLIEGGSEEEQKMGLEIIAKESERLTGLVDNLLDFSKMEDARIVLNIEAFDLKALMERTCSQFLQIAKKKDIRLKLETPMHKCICKGDMQRIKQVLVNVMDNSIKHLARGGHLIMRLASIRNDESGAELYRIEIEDNGTGIPIEHLGRIGEMFYKVESSSSGSGLGLAISNKIIELHKGSLVISNIVPHGTKVTIEILKEGQYERN